MGSEMGKQQNSYERRDYVERPSDPQWRKEEDEMVSKLKIKAQQNIEDARK